MSSEMKHHVFFKGTFMQHLRKTDFGNFPLSQEKNTSSLLKSGQLFLAFFAETWLHMHALKDWRVVLPVEIPSRTGLVRYEESESPYTCIGCPVLMMILEFLLLWQPHRKPQGVNFQTQAQEEVQNASSRGLSCITLLSKWVRSLFFLLFLF